MKWKLNCLMFFVSDNDEQIEGSVSHSCYSYRDGIIVMGLLLAFEVRQGCFHSWKKWFYSESNNVYIANYSYVPWLYIMDVWFSLLNLIYCACNDIYSLTTQILYVLLSALFDSLYHSSLICCKTTSVDSEQMFVFSCGRGGGTKEMSATCVLS